MKPIFGLDAFFEAAQGRKAQVIGAGRAWAYLIARRTAQAGPVTLVCANQKSARSWQRVLQRDPTLPSNSLCLALESPSWGNERYADKGFVRAAHLRATYSSHLGHSNLLVATLGGLATSTFTREELSRHQLPLAIGQELDEEAFEATLETYGYQTSIQANDIGTYANRGAIWDVYSPYYEDPIRIELTGDTITSIRHFSIATQRTTQQANPIILGPARDYLLDAAELAAKAQEFFEYLETFQMERADRDGMARAFRDRHLFPGQELFTPFFRGTSEPLIAHRQGAVLFMDPIEQCQQSYEDEFELYQKLDRQDRAQGRPSMDPSAHFLTPEKLFNEIMARNELWEFGDPHSREDFSQLIIKSQPKHPPPSLLVDGDQAKKFDAWHREINLTLEYPGTVWLVAESEKRLLSIQHLLQFKSLTATIGSMTDLLEGAYITKPGRVYLAQGYLPAPVWLEKESTYLIPCSAILGARAQEKRTDSQKLQNLLSSFRDLEVGSLVVHVDHGICRYVGLTSMEVGGQRGEFLNLEFAGGDRIYLPIDRLALLQKYAASDGAHPKIDKLKSPVWQKRKSRVGKAVKDMAEKLLMIRAQRQIAQGFSYQPPNEFYFRFESDFPYEETRDQAKAIDEVNADLSAPYPMDRLVCGDVGFGKTEVAMRAAMRVICDHKQVMVLVPTTVLCHQHLRSFHGRFDPYGIRVEAVGRFVGTKSTQKILRDFQAGKVDVLIGTHRLLSKDVIPKDLGLLVVDEEQKFGVAHKERILEMRANCDILTLTATPIPRTLHMSMMGLKDISVIMTPPRDRLSIKTYVLKYEEDAIKQAIEAEIARGGQVFYLHNRVQDIDEVASRLGALVPSAKLRVAHGQMQERALERAIVEFIEQKFDVLICTTIIESGIDMSNVNTLIVDRADQFGLSQLYQIRGRVGRSGRQSFAYFLTPRGRPLSDEARKRLEVLANFQELGAGFQIASHDLEIRGSGNLLGGEQSGHLADVGLELYTNMLEREIGRIRGDQVKEEINTELKIGINAVIPESYIPSDRERLDLYKRLFTCRQAEEISELVAEVGDRYGELPEEAGRIFSIAELKLLLGRLGATSLARTRPGAYEMKFQAMSEAQIGKIITIVNDHPKSYRLSPDYRLTVLIDPKLELDESLALGRIIEAVEPLLYA